jgi:hypothetical protein
LLQGLAVTISHVAVDDLLEDHDVFLCLGGSTRLHLGQFILQGVYLGVDFIGRVETPLPLIVEDCEMVDDRFVTQKAQTRRKSIT